LLHLGVDPVPTMASDLIHDVFSGERNLTTKERTISVVLGLGLAAWRSGAPAGAPESSDQMRAGLCPLSFISDLAAQ
jgi:hypothetical protein